MLFVQNTATASMYSLYSTPSSRNAAPPASARSGSGTTTPVLPV